MPNHTTLLPTKSTYNDGFITPAGSKRFYHHLNLQIQLTAVKNHNNLFQKIVSPCFRILSMMPIIQLSIQMIWSLSPNKLNPSQQNHPLHQYSLVQSPTSIIFVIPSKKWLKGNSSPVKVRQMVLSCLPNHQIPIGSLSNIFNATKRTSTITNQKKTEHTALLSVIFIILPQLMKLKNNYCLLETLQEE